MSAEYLRSAWANFGAEVCGRRVFDITDGFGGRPPISDAVFVVTREPPAAWIAEHPDVPFAFVTEGVASAVERAKAYAGDRNVAVTAGNVGGQALAAGLVGEVRIDLVPVVLGAGVRYTGDFAGTLMLDDPQVVQGNGVTHLH